MKIAYYVDCSYPPNSKKKMIKAKLEGKLADLSQVIDGKLYT
jgi:hypothetical protein